MGIVSISAWATIITAIITIANFAIKLFTKKEAKREFLLLIRLMVIGILGAIAGMVVWFIGSPIFGPMFGYGLGAIIASIIGALLISISMTKFINKNAGKLNSGKAGYAITTIIMASIYWVIAWFILNDLYNHYFQDMSESSRGMVSNIIGWGIAGIIGNAALISIANFVDMLFRAEAE